MKKPVIGVVLGALAFFVWGMISWMVLPWHNWTIKSLPEEQLISDTLKTVVEQPGFYFFPSDTIRQSDGTTARMDEKEWSDKYKKGPIGALIFSPTGKEPMGAKVFITGFVGGLALATLVMLIFSFCRERVRTAPKRVMLAALLGLVVGLAAHVPYWNWFNFPCNFTVVSILDTLVGFSILGLVMARFVPE